MLAWQGSGIYNINILGKFYSTSCRSLPTGEIEIMGVGVVHKKIFQRMVNILDLIQPEKTTALKL